MPSKPDVLLLHGALGSAAQFDALIPALSETFTCHTFDFAGHGQHFSGEAPDLFRIEDFAQQVVEWLDSQKIVKMDIFGYSMGGYVAVYLAHIWPGRVGRIVTLGTKYLWTRDSAAEALRLMAADTIEEKVPGYARMLEAQHTALGWRTVLDRTREMIFNLGVRNLVTSGVLRLCKHPIRIVVGDRDETVTVEESAEVTFGLQNGELEVLPRTGHPLDKVRPDRLIRSLNEFFAQEQVSSRG